MSISYSTYFFKSLSEATGTSEPAIRLLISVFAGYPLAYVFRKYVYGTKPNFQHLYFIVSAFCIGYFNYGTDFFHPLSAIMATYTALFICGGTALGVGVVFIFNMVYLLIGYYYTGTESYDINWTMPQCVLVLRLIGISFDLYDGQQKEETLGAENKKLALKQFPSILEFFGHMMFPTSFIIGPQFPMKRYQEFVAGEYGDKAHPRNLPNSEKAALKRFGLGILYLAIFQILGLFVSDNYILSEEFRELSFVRRMLLMGLWGRFTLYKYICCWLLTEGACIYFGVSSNGKDAEGNRRWDGLKNVKLSLIENTLEFTHYIQSFNVNTNNWVAHYVYKRLKFLGNRHLSQLGVLLFLAIWHGLHSGYYVCFLLEFMVVYMERDIKSIVKSNVQLTQIFDNKIVIVILKIMLRLYTFVFMGFCLLPFVLLTFSRYWYAFKSVDYTGLLLFALWPILYGPILHKIVPRNANLKIKIESKTK